MSNESERQKARTQLLRTKLQAGTVTKEQVRELARLTASSVDEILQADQPDYEPTEPDVGDYVIKDTGMRHLGYSVSRYSEKHIGTYTSRSDAEDAIVQDAGKGYTPNVWMQSDHGNFELVKDFAWE